MLNEGNPATDALTLVASQTAEALEDLLDTVWRCEASWRFDDRIELAVRVRS